MSHNSVISRYEPNRRLIAAGLALGLLLAGRDARAQLFGGAGSITYQDGDMYSSSTYEDAGSYIPNTGRFLVEQGDFLVTGAGTIGSGAATVELRDAATARILGLSSQALPNLELNVPAGTTMTSSGGIGTSLTMTSGHLLTTNNYTLTLASAAVISGETNAHYVKGHVSQAKALSGSAVVDYGQIGFTINPVGQSFPLTVERRTGLNLAGVSYGQNPAVAGFQGIDRVWALSSASTVATPVTVVLSWLSDNNRSLIFSGNNAQVWRSDDNGATWVKQGAAADGSGLSMTIATTALNALYTVSTTAAPLPVALVAFTGTLVKDDGLLRWRTASEKNSASYEVQQSATGQSGWQTLSSLPAVRSGTAPRDYTYTDTRISRYGVPVVYYRLRQIDLDGTATLSPVVTLKPQAAALLALELWPNPTAATTELRITAPTAESVAVTVYDATGRLVYKGVASSSTTLPLPSTTWPSGAYEVRAQQGTRTASKMLVRQ